MINYGNFEFDEKNGLFYEERLVAEFNLCVKEKETVLDSTGNICKKCYLIEASYIDGRDSFCKWVEKLKNLDLFGLFEINDCFLSQDDRKLLRFKLMHEAGKAKERTVLNLSNGLQMINGCPVYALGEHVFWKDSTHDGLDAVAPDRMHKIIFSDKTEMLQMCDAYIGLMPGVTEILFFGSLFAVVKPFVEQLHIPCGLVLALVAPAGHLKTTLARMYALWMLQTEEQEMGFYSREQDKAILKMIENHSGQNILIDDLHKIMDSNEARRQERRLDNVSRYVNATKGCANVILTGETMEKVGIFSCIDRIFQIRIPKMNAEGIESMKEKISSLASGLMPSVAFEFVDALMSRYDDVLKDIQDFYEKHSIDKSAAGTATRIHKHALFIRLTAYLFEKYLFHQEIIIQKYASTLSDAIAKHIQIQQKELEQIRLSEETHDYITELYEILNADGKYIKLCSKKTEYDVNAGNSCLLIRGTIHITSKSLKNAFFNKYHKYIPIKVITDSLSQEGILEEEPGSKGHQKTVEGKKQYVINTKIFLSYLKTNGCSIPKEMAAKYLD